MAAVDRMLDLIAGAFKALATLALAVMVALNLFNVAWRAVFDHAFGWVFSWTMLLFVWMLLFGFFVYVRTRRDVVVDVFVARLPTVPRRLVGLFAALVGILVMVAILKAAPTLLMLQTADMETIPLPMWLRSAPLFVSAALVLAHFLNLFLAIATGRARAFPPPAAIEQGAVE